MRALPQIDYDAHPGYDAFRAEGPARRQEALDRLTPALATKRRWLERGAEVFGVRATSSADSTADTLARDGAVGLRLDERLLEPVKAAAAPLVQSLKRLHAARHAKGKPLKFQHAQSDLQTAGVWTAAGEGCAAPIEALIKRSGALDIAAAYYPGCQVALHGVCVRRNVEDQPFFRRDDGSPEPLTMGMHIDSAATATLNGVIYLNEVGEAQGPFRYVKGSNHWNWDLEDRAIRKAVDEVGFPPTGDAAFLALPPELRRRANFGADLLDDTPASRELLSAEATFLSDACDMALFDSDGAHRGGDVREGHRASILFVLSVQPRRR
jgi:hypothetical protein